MSIRRSSALAVMVATIGSCPIYGQDKGIFSIPDSILLFANSDSQLRVISDSHVQTIERTDSRGRFYPAALSPDGTHVAWAIPLGTMQPNEPNHFALGISPTMRPGWRAYGDFGEVGAADFSPDGSKVAFVAERKGVNILSLAIGDMKAIPQLSGVPEQTKLGWSPDGGRLVAEVHGAGQTPAIYTVDLSTGDVRQIGKGHDPSWSPTGEWIAYFDDGRQKCIVVHPDGTGTKVVRDIAGHFYSPYRQFAYGAVWSPDGKELLVNEMKGEKGDIDVMILDLASGKVTRKSKNGLVVFGWARQKR